MTSEGFCWNGEGTDAFSGEGHERETNAYACCLEWRLVFGQGTSHEPVAIGCFFGVKG